MARGFPAPDDFLIGVGHCMVNGYDVRNAGSNPLFYSQQAGIPALPAADKDDVLHVYLKVDTTRVGSAEDPDLRNAQDINLETCVRDKLLWTVGVTRHPEMPPAGAYPLADIVRPNGQRVITQDMIHDLRRTRLNLARVLDRAQ